ncbi:MAG: helix-turn-helix transcriptional regulator [Chloroflexi bacterium]|nr:helix-turn-helix transcriptional regulator [Chloroflexota bacterium]MBI4504592.1 helix-turn-helix transcriptional regulator [Chloroflexota bacterium]
MSVASVALHDDDGALCTLVHVVQDITRSKTLEHFARRVGHEAAALLLGPDVEAPVREAAPLTRREQHVLALLADGADTAAIAARLCVSRSTARKHVQGVLRKLDAHRRLEAVAYAHRHGLLP